MYVLGVNVKLANFEKKLGFLKSRLFEKHGIF